MLQNFGQCDKNYNPYGDTFCQQLKITCIIVDIIIYMLHVFQISDIYEEIFISHKVSIHDKSK